MKSSSEIPLILRTVISSVISFAQMEAIVAIAGDFMAVLSTEVNITAKFYFNK